MPLRLLLIIILQSIYIVPRLSFPGSDIWVGVASLIPQILGELITPIAIAVVIYYVFYFFKWKLTVDTLFLQIYLWVSVVAAMSSLPVIFPVLQKPIDFGF